MTQLCDSLHGVLMCLLVQLELGEDGADVKDRARRVALERPQVHLEFKGIHVSVHDLAQVPLLFRVELKPRFVLESLFQKGESTLEVLLLLAKAA